jgi:Fur family transcriptional regulator, ferric uptake regulator
VAMLWVEEQAASAAPTATARIRRDWRRGMAGMGKAGESPGDMMRGIVAAAPMANIDELKSTGLKATLPRLKILDVFQKGTQRHMTAEDVFRVLLEERSDIGLATVYRVLTQFEQAGILSRSHFESGKAVYELNEGTHHDHLVCLDCGRVEEFYDAEIEKRQQAVAKLKGFQIAEHALSLYAHCTKTNCPHRPPHR